MTTVTQEFIVAWRKGLGQQNRLLKLDTPLGKDVLLPQRLVAEDRLGRGYAYTLDALSLEHNIPLKQLIAQPVTLWLQQADRRSYLPLHGYVQRACKLGSDGQLSQYQLTFCGWLDFLKYRKDSRIWQDRDAIDILSEVFNRHPQGHGRYRFLLSRQPLTRSYCTQYESDWHFAMRLMEEEGWFCFQEHQSDGQDHLLIVTDSARSLPPLQPRAVHFHRGGSQDAGDKITRWSSRRQVLSRQQESVSDDYKAPRQAKDSRAQIAPDHGNIPQQLEVYEYTSAYAFGRQAEGDQQSRRTVEGWQSQAKRHFAWSTVRRMAAGRYFDLEDHPDYAGGKEARRQFITIGLRTYCENNLPLSAEAAELPGSLRQQLAAVKRERGIEADNGSSGNNGNNGFYINQIELQRRDVAYRSPMEHHKPVMHTQTATVTGPAEYEIFTDALNRVQVTFAWAHGVATCWLRVSYPNAGDDYGGVFVPRIQMEVIVTFLGGNIDRPVITGRLYNSDQAPHWHSDGLLSGHKSKEHKGYGYNQLLMDDHTGQSRLQLYSSSNHSQLNLGYLVAQQGNRRQAFYGNGFALNTTAYGAVVAGQGLYLSSFGRAGASGSQLDVREAHQQLTTAQQLTQALSEAGVKAGAPPLAAQAALKQFTDATQQPYDGAGQEPANRFRQPILLAASPAGIGMTTPSSTHLHSGQHATVSSGQDTNLAAGNNLAANAANQISLFANQGDISHTAAQGKVLLQAQANDLDVIADRVLRLISNRERIELWAAKEIVMGAGGSAIRINAQGITDITAGARTMHHSDFSMPGPSSASAQFQTFEHGQINFDDRFVVINEGGRPVPQRGYEITRDDGAILRGVTDQAGRIEQQQSLLGENVIIRILGKT